MMKTVHDQKCAIHIGEGSLQMADQVPLLLKEDGNCILLCEKNASEKILPVVFDACPNLRKLPVYHLDASEKNKHIESLIPLWKTWVADNIDRKTIVINIGGGVLCDMGGFAASVYKRGLAFVNIPTTLLAMVDASVGGKTAVDLDEMKNIIGTFARPESVIIDPVFLHTLPEREYLSGVAEIIKMQIIGNRDLSISGLEILFDRTRLPIDFIRFAIEEKARITAIDFKEDNLRKILNFGHTFGHAFEALSLKRKQAISHGEAVAHGMICELYLSWLMTGLDRTCFEDCSDFLRRHYGIFPFKPKDIPDIIAYMENDKKNRSGKIYPVLIPRFGECRYEQASTRGIVEKVLQNYPFF